MMKEEQPNEEDVLLGVVSHVLSFTLGEFCKYGYLLAFEKDLSDLKGLVDAASMYENDYEVLEGVKDPAVQLLLQSSDKVFNCIKTYLMINSLDEFEVMTNEEFNQHASNNYHFYVDQPLGQSYKELMEETCHLYFSLMHMIYHTCCQLDLGRIDLPDELFDDFYTGFLDVIDGCRTPTEDKNIKLLYDLLFELNQDMKRMEELR
nr:hypothetical protein [Pedobacter sp. ASV19]